jgi:GNAT superfamily N-acetyltransferase
MPSMAKLISTRPVSPADVPQILRFVRLLAEYEHEPEAVLATEEHIRAALFGAPPVAEALIAAVDGVDAGFALFFVNFSTWTGLPGLYLEDLFVLPEYRKRGLGRALLVHLAGIARERGYGRFEWAVLDWNEPAISFYRSLGARAMSEWTTFRLEGEGIGRLADGGG